MNPVGNQTRVWPPVATQEWDARERELFSGLTREDLPRHVCVIMDGNGRWARSRGLRERIRGHEAGIESVREITRTCAMLEVDTLTLYAFSKENWQRPRVEVAALMTLLRRFSPGGIAESRQRDVPRWMIHRGRAGSRRQLGYDLFSE